MGKETYYFSHDYNARTDMKIKKLIAKHGYEGYGVFWAIVEDLYNNDNCLPTDFDCIAYNLRVNKKIVASIIQDFELFVIKNKTFGSISIEKRLEERNGKSAKARESALKRWKEDANALRTESDGNAIKDTIGKDTIEKEIKVKDTNTSECAKEKSPILKVVSKQEAEMMEYPTFDDFWNLYDKKVGREKSEKKWHRLAQEEKEKIMDFLPGYIAATPDIQYRKDPATFLYNKSWNDEIIKPNGDKRQPDLSYRNPYNY